MDELWAYRTIRELADPVEFSLAVGRDYEILPGVSRRSSAVRSETLIVPNGPWFPPPGPPSRRRTGRQTGPAKPPRGLPDISPAPPAAGISHPGPGSAAPMDHRCGYSGPDGTSVRLRTHGMRVADRQDTHRERNRPAEGPRRRVLRHAAGPPAARLPARISPPGRDWPGVLASGRCQRDAPGRRMAA
jgi:hypothetical protein